MPNMACPEMDSFLNKFEGFTSNPVKFLEVQSGVKNDIKNLVKSLYDFTKTQENGENKTNKSALPELIVEDLDEEQVWQQIELQNNECWDSLVWDVANCMSIKNELTFPVEVGAKQTETKKKKRKGKNKEAPENVSEEPKENSTNQEEELTSRAPKNKVDKSRNKQKSSIVDDKFFKLQEMEQFLLKEERNEGKSAPHDSDEESIDYFEDIDDDEEENDGEKDAMYTDFFGQEEGGIENGDEVQETDSDNDNEIERNLNNGGEVDDEIGDNDYNEMGENDDELANEMDSEDELEGSKKKSDKKVRFAQPSSSSEDDSEQEQEVEKVKEKEEKKSEFELRQERLKKHIERLEEKNLNEAPWQLKGEVDATKRPQNSLLEEVVDFDLTSRPAPIITEQTTFTLEDIIKQRIKDKAWDDVVKKEKPVDDQLSFRKTEILDHAKSKQSLAQVYEAEYLKQKQALSGEPVEEKEPEEHIEIRDSMNELFAKLDALCHYHYTPKAAQPDVKIVSNTPAISMEEVAPVATSDAALLAPEEVKKKQKGELMSKEERTQTDKNRERRKKKKLQRQKGPVQKVTEHRNTKKGTEVNNDKSLKTSKAFFQQLNDDATSLIKSKNKSVKNNKGK